VVVVVVVEVVVVESSVSVAFENECGKDAEVVADRVIISFSGED